MKIIIAALCLLSLAGCAAYVDDSGLHVTGKPRGLSLDQLRTIAAGDLRAADAKAVAAGDKSGQLCWEYLMAVPSSPGALVEAASTVENARLIAMAAAGPCSGILQPVVGLVGAL